MQTLTAPLDEKRATDLDEAARAVLRRNDRGGYTVPTEGLYPYQWNWDSAFAAFGFASFDPARAWQELRTLFSGQWDSGMVPHILFHTPDPGYFPGPDVWQCNGPIPSSGITQPPLVATFARWIHARDSDLGAAHLSELFGPLCNWHRWFMRWRCDRGAIFITHPWEAGRDNAPDWDTAMSAIDPVGVGPYQRRDVGHVNPQMRPTKYDYDRYIWLVQQARAKQWDDAALAEDPPFRVADPTMTFTLMRACRDLGWIADLLGRDRTEIDLWITTLENGAATLWNDALGVHDARDLGSGQRAGCVSNASFLSWYGGLQDDRSVAAFDRVMSLVPFGVPSHSPDSAKFNPKRYWRGPTWAIMNMLIGVGLQNAGQTDRAVALRAVTRQLIAQNGFAEYFDPLDGSPAGGGAFTWTAVVWLTWASPNAEDI